MINQVNQTTDRIDEAIDSFEEGWSLESRGQIRSLLSRYHLANNSNAIAELIRIDIELRYAQGIAISLDEYLEEFGAFLGEPRDVVQIAFEDFRAREAHGHPVSSSRWRGIPGVDNESWFRNLSQRRVDIVPARRAKEVDATFEAALEAIGFRLIHELGRGAFSQVFLATQNDLADRYVVLKIIDQAVSEPQNMAMLQHTNIVPIYSFDRILSRSVICMPYAGRVTMADFLKAGSEAASRGGESLVTTVLNRVHETVADSGNSDGLLPGMPIPAAEEDAVLQPLERLRSMGCNELAIWMFRRLAAALAHSHSRGVLHGDLKPANVLIRNDGEPALLDFNLAQTLDHEDNKYAGGTLPYMSPETFRVVMGQTIAPHNSSDIYSIGVMLYEFVTGRLPYPAPASAAAVDIEPAIAARRVGVSWEESDQVSQGLQSIIEKCLQYEPQQRYESAEQLQQDLDREAQSQSLKFANEPLASTVKKCVRRNQKLLTSATIAAVALAVLVPLVVYLSIYRNQSIQLAAIKQLDSFSDESAEVLSAAMADPQRFEEHVISASMLPLEKYGILGAEGKQALNAPQLTAEEQTKYRSTIVRHVCQLAISEIARLRKTVDDQEGLPPEALDRLDLLIATAQQYHGQAPSRALTYLAAERALLSGNEPLSLSLSADAAKMPFDASDNEQYLEAVRLMSVRRWAEARGLLTELVDQNSIPSAIRWTSLGRSQYGERAYERAKISFTKSIDRAPNSSRLYLLRGMCYHKLGDHERAEDDFIHATELEPTLVLGWIDLGVSRMAQERFPEAVNDFTTGLKLSPKHVYLLLCRSQAYKRAGNEEAAQRDFDEAMKSDNVSVTSLWFRAKVRKKRGDYLGAESDLLRARELNPSSIPILKSMASLYAGHLDRTEEAIDLLTEADALEPNNERLWIDRAVLHARLGQSDDARDDLRAAMAGRNSRRTMYQAACVNALLGEDRRVIALGWLSKAIQLGYGAEDFQEDPDLDSVRDMDLYRAIVRTVRIGETIRKKQNTSELDPDYTNLDLTISPEEFSRGSEQ